MNKRRRARYFLAVYLLVASLATILALVGIFSAEPVRTLLLNLSTELLGVVLVFFLVNRLFLLEEWDLSKRMEELTNQLEERVSFLRGREYRDPEFEQLLSECSEICLLGYNFRSFIGNFRESLTNRVRDGARLRVLVIDPESKAAELILENSRTTEFQSDLKMALKYIKLMVEESRDGGKGHTEVRLLNWVPSCSLIIIDGHKPEGYIRVGVYPPFYQSMLNKRAHFALTRWRDKRWYDVFVDQYESLWSQAQILDLNQAE